MTELKLRIEKYRPNALIFIEGNRNNNNFYILKSGQVVTTRIHDTGDESQVVLNAGDPFGVVSCIANRPRIETAKTLTAVEVISVERDQVIPLIQNNTTVAMKILRWFSRKLRDFDAAITRMALKKPVVEDIDKMKDIGDYYFTKKKYRLAFYCYSRFLKEKPDTEMLDQVRAKLQQIEQSIPGGVGFRQVDNFTRVYSDKSMLFCEHERGDEVFIVQNGRVQISKIVGDKELLLAVLGQGDVIGEMAILDNKPRNASAIAFGDTTVLVMNKENFFFMVQNNPQIVHKILALLSERIWVAYRQFENLAIKDDYKRIMDAFMIQLEKQKINLEENKEFNLGLSPVDLLRLIGINEEKEDQFVDKILADKNFNLLDNTIIVKDLQEFAKGVESIRKFQLNIEQHADK